MIRVEFDTENAAFNEEGGLGYEAARILHDAADRIEQGVMIGPLFDVNGNKVGWFEVHPSRRAEPKGEQPFGFSFAGEAYATFQTLLDRCRGFGVTITTQEGEQFNAVLVGPDPDSEWGDAVLSHEVKEGEDYLRLSEYTSSPRSDRVGDVRIH